MSGEGNAERVVAAKTTASFFSVLSVSPIIGRPLSPEDNEPGQNGVLLSYGLWRRNFAAAPNVMGKTIWLDDKPYVIAGVMPPDFNPLRKIPDLWLPLAFDEASMNRGLRSLKVMARLKPTSSLEQARADMSLIAEQTKQAYPESDSNSKITVNPLIEEIVGKIKLPLLIVFAAAGLVLMIGAANITGLLLSQTAVREREMCIRAALGARRLRILRQMLTEGLLLAVLGGASGFVLSIWGLRLVSALGPTNVPRSDELAVSGWTIGFTVILSLTIGALCGFVSAQQVSRADLNDLLKSGGWTTAGGLGGRRLRIALLVFQVALSLLLSIGAALLVESFQRLWRADLGFNPAGILTMELPLSESRYPGSREQVSFCRRLLEQTALVPDLQSVAIASSLPIIGMEEYSFTIEGHLPLPGEAETLTASRQAVSPDYFHAMGVALLRGRVFSERDVEGQSGVAIINNTMAHRYWGNDDPTGKRIKIASGGSTDLWVSIVGVVQDVRESASDTGPKPQFYVPYFQDPEPDVLLVVRSPSSPPGVAAAVRVALRSIDKDQPAANVHTMEEIIARSVSQRRFIMALMTIFAVVALVLASLGIYGMISYSVSQRTREVGIRVALGARPLHVLTLVLAPTMVHVLIGVGVGLFGAFASTQLISSLLYDLSATDGPTFVAVPLLLMLASLIASYIPARKAMKTSPAEALRCE